MSSSQLQVSFFAEGGNYTPELIISMPRMQLVRGKRGAVRLEEKEPLVLGALYEYLKTLVRGRAYNDRELQRLVKRFPDDRLTIEYVTSMISMLRIRHFLKVRQSHLTPPFGFTSHEMVGTVEVEEYRLVVHFQSIVDKPLAAIPGLK